MKHRIVQALAGFLVLSFVCRAAAEDYEHYTRYVESDGTQSIDLGFKLSSDMTIECVYEQLNQQTTTYQALFGARTDASTGDISFFSTVNGTHFTGGCQTGGGESYKIYRNRFRVNPATFFAQRRYLVKRTPTEGWTLTDLETGLNVPKLLGDDQAQGQTWNGVTFSTANNIKLFTIDGVSIDSSSSTWGRATMRLYLLRVSDSSGKVLHEIIPGQEGDRIGVRDTVTGAYLYPTEGKPLKIVDTKPLSVQIDPLEPTPPGDYDVALDCLISDGSQWIETGVTLDNEMTIDIDCTPLAHEGDFGVFGARSDSACSNISVLVTANMYSYVDFNDAACISSNREVWAVIPSNMAGSLSDGVRYNFHLSKMKRSITNLETGKRLAANTKLWDDHPFSTESTAQIFGVAGRTGAHAKMKLYRVKIANNEGVLHNYFPVLKNGVAGLYDCVTGDFLMNAGEGEFDYTCEETPLINEGALKSFVTAQVPWLDTTTVTTVVRPINVGSQSYVESDGTQEIDLGFKLKSDMNIEVVFAGVGAVPASQGFFGARGSGADNFNIALFRGKHAEGMYVSADCQNRSYDTYRMKDASAVPEEIYRATLKGGGWTLTNEKSGTPVKRSNKAWDGETFETPTNALLFRINGTTIDDTAWARAKVRIYSVVVRDKDGTLLHDLVPSVNGAGVVGLFDRASADAANAWKFPTGDNPKPNPLTFVGARFAPDAPRAYTNVVGRVDDSCELPVTISPLRPGTTYEWFAFAEDQRGDFVSSSITNTFTTVSDAAPAGATLSLKVEVLFGRTKAGHLRLRLTRTDTANAAAVTLVAGKDYGGADPANWRNVMACGSFAAGEATIVVDTPFLPKNTNYLRAFTADGEWSETVLILETDFVPGKQGLTVIVQ